VRESTRISYHGSFERHILPEVGKIPQSDLERKRVKKLDRIIVSAARVYDLSLMTQDIIDSDPCFECGTTPRNSTGYVKRG